MGNTPGKKDDALLRSLQKSLPVLRKAAKLSQKDLASTLGVSRQTVVNWENEKTYLNPMQGFALMAIVQSFDSVHPGMKKVVEAYFEHQDETRTQTVGQRTPLEERIARYIAERMAASPKEEVRDDEDKENLSAG